jgi:hypothetical protein
MQAQIKVHLVCRMTLPFGQSNFMLSSGEKQFRKMGFGSQNALSASVAGATIVVDETG